MADGVNKGSTKSWHNEGVLFDSKVVLSIVILLSCYTLKRNMNSWAKTKLWGLNALETQNLEKLFTLSEF